MMRISSQTSTQNETATNTGWNPTKTLANPLAPGQKGSAASCQSWIEIATRPSTSATSAPASQTDLVPALMRSSASVWTAALTTNSAMTTTPTQDCGCVAKLPVGYHRWWLLSDFR